MKKLISILSLVTLLIPSVSSAYTVQKGDTLWGLYGSNWRTVAAQNGITDPAKLQIGQVLDDGGMLGGTPLPVDDYDTFLTAPLGSSATTTFVNEVPGVSSSVYTIFGSDGVTPREKIYCTGTQASPKALTGCVRGLSFSPLSGVIDETPGTGLTHSKNARIAVTDNINFSGKALAMLYGFMTSSIRSTDGNFLVSSTVYFNNTNVGVRNLNGVLQWSVDGFANSYSFTSSSISQLVASSTLGIQVISSAIGINASSTRGMTFDSSGRLYQLTSSTTGIGADSTGIKIVSSTLLGIIASTTPTVGKVPLGDTNGTLIGWNTVGDYITAGENLSTRSVVYVSSTGNLYRYSSSTAIFDTNLVGIVLATTTAGSQTPVLFDGTFTTTGLTAGSVYYTGAASGTISTTYTDQSVRLGVALTTTKLRLNKSQNKVYDLGAIAPVVTVSGGSSNQPQFSTTITVRAAVGEKIMVVAGGNLSAGSCDSASAILQENSADTNMNCSTLGGGCPLVYSTTTPTAGLYTYRVRVNATDGGNCTATWAGNFTVWKF